jgi:cellobiose-specific phosphotransferase system component IIC
MATYDWVSIIGVLLNSISRVVMLVPFLLVYTDGKLKRKTKERILDISTAKYDENIELACPYRTTH